ncbi:MAG: M56 family metallopeptidase [Armatimonadota bacterium]
MEILRSFAASILLWIPWMVEMQIRSLLLLAVTCIALWVLRRSSAAMRHLTLTLTVAGLLALPLLSLLLPSWSAPFLPLAGIVVAPPALNAQQGSGERTPPVPILTKAGSDRLGGAAALASISPVRKTSPGSNPGSQMAAQTAEAANEPQSLPVGAIRDVTAGKPVPVPGTSTGAYSLSIVETILALVSSVWAVGAALLLLRLSASLYHIHRTYQQMDRVQQLQPATSTNSALTESFSDLVSFLGIRQPVRLLIAPAEMPGLSPMTWGVVRPVVLLPAEAVAWPPDRLRPVLLHELAHVQRGDWGTEMLARVVCALYWPNPLIWLLVRRIQSESEHACDDKVLLAGVAPTDYAHHLVEVVRNLKAQREHSLLSISTSTAAVMMTRNSRVESRVRAVLAKGNSRRPTSARIVAVALVGASGLLFPLASLRSAAPEGRKEVTPKKESPTANETPSKNVNHSVSLPGGIRAEFLPVKGNLSNGTPASWKPDGTGVEPITTRVVKMGNKPDGTPVTMTTTSITVPPFVPPPYVEGERILAARVSYPTEALKRGAFVEFGVKRTPSGSPTNGSPQWFNFETASLFDSRKPKLQQSVYSIRQKFPAEQKQVTLVLRVASGPRKTIIAGPPTRGATRRLSTGEVARISAAYQSPNTQPANGKRVAVTIVKVTVPTRLAGNDSDYELLPVGVDGRTFYPSHWGSDIPDLSKPEATIQYRFRTAEVPLSRVKEFQFAARPIKTVEFPNIKLQPGSAASRPASMAK